MGKRTVLALKVINTISLAVSVLALPYPYGIFFEAVKKKRTAHLARDLWQLRSRTHLVSFHLLSLFLIMTSITRKDISKEEDIIKRDNQAQRTFTDLRYRY